MPFQVQVQPSGRQFAVNEGETLLEAGIRQNMGLPYGCKDGACGSCKCQKISGEVVHKPYQPSALTQEELAQLVGASRETVNKALADFAQRGWLRLEGKSVVILDRERLSRRAR